MITVNSIHSDILIERPYLQSWSQLGVSQFYCLFDPSKFDERLFHNLGINFDSSLANAVIKRKSEFLAGRYCAKQALLSLGIENFSVGIGASRNPLWPSGVKGSISHCCQAAIAVVTQNSDVLGVGIDMEDQVNDELLEQTKDYILQGSETHLLYQGNLSVATMFTIIFSIKESFYKAAFSLVNAFFDFDAVTVLSVNDTSGEVVFQLNYSLHDRLQKGRVFTGEYSLRPSSKSDGSRIVTFVSIL
jgi:Phosphopantetheinyl transferase component of siderophore synthetase